MPSTSRRTFLTATAVTGAVLAAAQPVAAQASAKSSVRYCLNMSTINGGSVPLRQQIKIAAEAGYDGVELWLRDIEKFIQEGGKLPELRREISDLGLQVESSIAFGKWIVGDEAERKAGLEQCKKDMANVRALGGRRMAAPPAGATDAKSGKLDLAAVGERYRDLLRLGRQYDVLPQIELWGFSYNMSTLAEVLYVAAAADDPDACVLLDVYHLYKGGCNFANMSLVPGPKMHVLHMNDYPAEPKRAEIKDEHRVYPGDGVAPLDMILATLMRGGFSGVLSLELFNREYWKQDPALVAKTGIEKMKAAVASASGLV